MKRYIRTETIYANAKRITQVTETTWKTWVEWTDGTVMSVIESTLEEMGWSSLKEFLQAKNTNGRFIPVPTIQSVI